MTTAAKSASISMSRSPSGCLRNVTSLDPYLEHEEEPCSKDSTELKELLLESQPALDGINEPIRPTSTHGRFKLWRKRRRRAAGNSLPRLRARGYWYNLKCAGFRILWRLLKALIIFILGIIVTILAVPNADYLPVPDGFDRAFGPFDPSISSQHFPAEYFRSVLPIPCHSHNDYRRRRPLFSALGTGCISIEADVWLIDEELYVGHSGSELEENRTLSKMYIEPLVDLLEQRNKPTGLAAVYPSETRSQLHGVFFEDPEQTLTLVIDFKSNGFSLWPVVQEALEPLRERDWLTYWDGRSRVSRPITVVGTGSAPFDMIISNSTYRDIFFDAPLEALSTPDDEVAEDTLEVRDVSGVTRATYNYKYNPSNSHYASSSMSRALGPLWYNSFSESQIDLMRKQTEQARERGLVPRYWGTPRWPRGLRNSVWEVLIKENVGILNVDDLRAARRGAWGRWPQPETSVGDAE